MQRRGVARMSFSSSSPMLPLPLLSPLTLLALLLPAATALMDVAWWSSVAQLNMGSMLSSSGAGGRQPPPCPELAGLSPGQARICDLFRDHMPAVGAGAFHAIEECQYQFRQRRWNCSTPLGEPHVGPFHKLGTREAAFTHAILSAGVTHEIGRRCKQGMLPNCGCSEEPPPKDIKENFAWNGCGDNLDYGFRFARDFIDVREKEETIKRSADEGRSLVNRRNNEAGRRLLRRQTRPKCKCHGVSGACNLKTCWLQMPPMRAIGDILLKKYNGAKRVMINSRGNMQLVSSPNMLDDPPEGGGISRRIRPRQQRALPTDLVYLDDSPDYCRLDRALGTVGTAGRVCSRDTDGPEGCETLCCGRGFQTQTVQTRSKCRCKFEWCCQVVCDTCINTTHVHTCN